MDSRCPGGFHDARVWRFSEAKQFLEQRWPRFLLAGDSAYPKSTVLVTPYTQAEAQDDETKRLFNLRYKKGRFCSVYVIYLGCLASAWNPLNASMGCLKGGGTFKNCRSLHGINKLNIIDIY